MSIVGETFIRIRPDTTGFKSETEGAVRAGVAGVGKIIAGAFAVKGVFDFGKQIVEHAADVQKQIEAIKTEFGSASDSVIAFGEHGATALGVSAHLADQTSARFGIIAKSLGLTNEQAATMTVGFEKLAGSVSQIRNVDPATLFQNLPLALAGNTRSMRQLGIVTDQTQLKIAAFKLGLTDSITQALTPAQKALAIYAIGTANLGQFQAQATSHAGDFANVQRKLSAEFDNAKDSLGRGLLPAMEKVFGFLANTLPGAVVKIKDDFKTFRDDLEKFTGPIGHITGLVETFVGAFAVGKIIAFAGAIRTDLIANGFAELQVATKVEQAAYLEAFGSMEVATIGLSATIKGALISTGIGAIAVAAGIAAELVINHWSTVKRFFMEMTSGWVRIFGAAWVAIKQGAKAAAYYLLESFTFALQKILELASHLPFVGDYARQALQAIQGFIDQFTPDFSKVTAAWAAGGQQAGQAFAAAASQAANAIAANSDPNKALQALADQGFSTDILSGAAYKSTAQTKAALAALNDNLRTAVAENTSAVDSARNALGSAGQSLASAIQQQAADVRNAVQQAQQNLTSLGQGLAQTVATFIDQGPLGQYIKRLQDALAGRQSAQQRKQLVAAVVAAQKSLNDSLAAVGPSVTQNPQERTALNAYLAPQRLALEQAQSALQDFNTQAHIGTLQSRAQRLKDSISRGFSDLTDEFNKGAINTSTFNTRIAALLAKGGINYRNAGKTLGVSFGDGFRDQVTTILQQAFAINQGPQLGLIGGTIVRPLDVLRTDQQNVAKAQHQVALKQTGLQERIAKASEKTAADLAAIKSVQLGPTASTVTKPAPTSNPRGTAVRHR